MSSCKGIGPQRSRIPHTRVEGCREVAFYRIPGLKV